METDFISPDKMSSMLELFVSFGLKPSPHPGERGLEVVWPLNSQSTVDSQERYNFSHYTMTRKASQGDIS